VTYRTLDPKQIIATLVRLELRIGERFPDSGLSRICHEIRAIGEHAQERARAIARPNLPLRIGIFAAIAAGLAGLVMVVRTINVQVGPAEIFSVFQGIEAAMNIVVLPGASLFFLTSLELRMKRHRALRDLHVFRSLAHVVDMHQLTKDPSSVGEQGPATASSPRHNMSKFELTRYLDYCSEMLSLINKLAAIYAQNLPDTIVIDAVNDIEELTTSLSSKIWQKITILDMRN
jgi:hypothetical protein